jgi:hypothetical protein
LLPAIPKHPEDKGDPAIALIRRKFTETPFPDMPETLRHGSF